MGNKQEQQQQNQHNQNTTGEAPDPETSIPFAILAVEADKALHDNDAEKNQALIALVKNPNDELAALRDQVEKQVLALSAELAEGFEGTRHFHLNDAERLQQDAKEIFVALSSAARIVNDFDLAEADRLEWNLVFAPLVFKTCVCWEEVERRYVLLHRLRNLGIGVGIVTGSVLVGAAAVGGAMLALPAAGFATTGVVGGSLAASVQSAYYGAFTTGAFSVLQSWGAVGIPLAAQVAIGSTSAGITGAIGAGIAYPHLSPTHPTSAKEIVVV